MWWLTQRSCIFVFGSTTIIVKVSFLAPCNLNLLSWCCYAWGGEFTMTSPLGSSGCHAGAICPAQLIAHGRVSIWGHGKDIHDLWISLAGAWPDFMPGRVDSYLFVWPEPYRVFECLNVIFLNCMWGVFEHDAVCLHRSKSNFLLLNDHYPSIQRAQCNTICTTVMRGHLYTKAMQEHLL